MTEGYKARVTFTDLEGNDVTAVMLKDANLNVATCPGIEIAGEFSASRIQELPTKFGAVVRSADGTVWSRDSDKELPWNSIGLEVASDYELSLVGGFTVLFEGVDA